MTTQNKKNVRQRISKNNNHKTISLKKEPKKAPQQTKQKSPSGLPSKVLITNQSLYRVQSFKTTDFARSISYDLIDSVYDRTILKKIITKYKFSIVPNFS